MSGHPGFGYEHAALPPRLWINPRVKWSNTKSISIFLVAKWDVNLWVRVSYLEFLPTNCSIIRSKTRSKNECTWAFTGEHIANTWNKLKTHARRAYQRTEASTMNTDDGVQSQFSHQHRTLIYYKLTFPMKSCRPRRLIVPTLPDAGRGGGYQSHRVSQVTLLEGRRRDTVKLMEKTEQWKRKRWLYLWSFVPEFTISKNAELTTFNRECWNASVGQC